MSRRRKIDDDDDDGANQHKRRRTSEPMKIEDRLESLICRVGEKSTSSLESNLEGLAGVLEADLPNYKSKILRILTAVARLLPEKLTIYTTLSGLLNARNYNFGGELVESLMRQLKEALKGNYYTDSLYIVRFLADLVNCHVIAAPSLVAMFENFVAVTQEEEIPQVRSDWYVYAVLSSLPWVGKELYEKKDVEMERILTQIEAYIKKRKKLHMPMLQVWTSDKPHPQEEYLDCLWAQTQKMRSDRWQERHLLRPYLAFDSVLCEALQHNLPPFTPPPHSQDSVYPKPHVIFRLFDYTDAPEGPVMPGSHAMERFVIEENLRCIIKTHWRERKTCAVQLVSYLGRTKIPLNYMVIEVIFGELFQLPCPPCIEVMYTALLIELCKLQPSSLPQVLAQTAEMLYMRLENMNTTCIDRFINWFSHHLSNFQFRWSWEDWADCLTLDQGGPKPKFVREVLEKCLRSCPLCLKTRWCLTANRRPTLRRQLCNELSCRAVLCQDDASWLSSMHSTVVTCAYPVHNVPYDDLLFDMRLDQQGSQRLHIIEFLLPYCDGFREPFCRAHELQISHFSVLSLFHEIFKLLADTDEGKVHILKSMYDVWRNHPQMMSVLVDKMIRMRIVDCAAVANWVFSADMAQEFTRLYVWEIIHSTVRKMNKHVQKVQRELEEARDKLDRHLNRIDSDDEDERPEDASSLEEAVERLQEKLEMAQSEQKNLFLVIFQRFIMILTEHLVRCETSGTERRTPWYKNCIERLQQIFLQHQHTIQLYMGTLENLLFTSELDPHILAIFQQFCALTA
uniref:Nuclear cap binding protein subunit 1 n=1 Tax=Petromyzon marinus TaxID=7757 RepID=S4RLP3_PETMA